MGEIDEGLERSERTKPIPVNLSTRVKFLWAKVAKQDTKALAETAGISVRTAQRWVKALKAGEQPAMTKANERRVEQQVRAKWQPKVKQRVRNAAETNGFMLTLSGTFGFSSAAGSTDDPRPRTITHKMPGGVAQELYAARDAGASQAEQERVLAKGLREHYFKDNGTRAASLDVELNDVAWIDVEGL
ncbi:helix-hairpin-helix domain-containing protein (plasmid) [Kitasatospora sp. NBC_00070]|uniref:telomere-protecting terminal protein Tpg n=1 Tax=Kitasatospora sp. NBC_00070 TaxID=2975962 RepID=UPI002F910D68